MTQIAKTHLESTQTTGTRHVGVQALNAPPRIIPGANGGSQDYVMSPNYSRHGRLWQENHFGNTTRTAVGAAHFREAETKGTVAGRRSHPAMLRAA